MPSSAQLQTMHPLFAANMHLVGKSAKDCPPLSSDLSNLEAWILERGCHPRPPTNGLYSNLSAKGKPTADSRGSMGFRFLLGNLKDWDEKVSVSMRTGLSHHVGTCEIVLPRKNHPEFKQVPLMQQLLELVVAHWPVYFAIVAERGWSPAVNWIDKHPEGLERLLIGWLTYVEDASIVEALPAGLKHEPLGPGLMFQLCDHFPSYENPDDVALGLRVRQALQAAGRLRVRKLTR